MLNTEAIIKILISLVGIALLFVGLGVITSSRRAQYSDTARVGVNSLAGIVLVALGAGSFALVAFGSRIIETLFQIN
jgi:uncharacterized membrane protein